MAPGGCQPTMGSGPATVVKGGPGSRGPGGGHSADTGWLLTRPPPPLVGAPAGACGQDCKVARPVPGAGLGPTCCSLLCDRQEG